MVKFSYRKTKPSQTETTKENTNPRYLISCHQSHMRRISESHLHKAHNPKMPSQGLEVTWTEKGWIEHASPTKETYDLPLARLVNPLIQG